MTDTGREPQRQTVAKRIVDRIIEDLTDKGLRQEWEQIDGATQIKIRDSWVRAAIEESEQLKACDKLFEELVE